MHTYSLAVCEDDRLIRDSVIRLCGEILEESNIPNVITPFSSAEELECFLEKNGERFDDMMDTSSIWRPGEAALTRGLPPRPGTRLPRANSLRVRPIISK